MTNHLAKEASPYLKMHANNPVDWYPWGEEALTKANDENKPILLSIGYTACHWCHVMAHESFEDLETAKIMNELFINIKVDREERPDLDKIYQLSAQLLTRQAGGWPLTIFLMPTKHIPFFAGTYFPKVRRGDFPSFKEVLEYVNFIYHQHQAKLKQQNISFDNILQELDAQTKMHAAALDFSPLLNAVQLLEQSYDPVNGGFGTAPKFPMTPTLDFLLLYSCTGDTKARQMVLHSLQKMHLSGLYDQIGGGFFRYSVDEKWQIPHFEKMLYDNALLLALLVQTQAKYSSKENSLLTQAAAQTANWILNEMQSSEGAYYATLAADTEGEEGKFYLWSKAEIESILTKQEFNVISSYYGLGKHPNFKKSWHLQVDCLPEELASQFNMSISEIQSILIAANQKLYHLRAHRVWPQCDEKIIASWNGLTIKAMALAGFYLKETKFTESALACVNFIRRKMFKAGKLYSVYKDDQVLQEANLDDYSFLIEGIFYLLQARWDNDNYIFLIQLVRNALAQYEDQEAGGFYFTSHDHEKLIYRLKQYADEAIPSSNGVLTKMLLYLGYLQGENLFIQAAERSLQNAFPHLEKYPDSYCSFLTALALFNVTPEIDIIRGQSSLVLDWKNCFSTYYSPNRIGFFIDENENLPSPLHIKEPKGSIVAYICHGSECAAPVMNRQEFENGLRSNQFRIKR